MKTPSFNQQIFSFFACFYFICLFIKTDQYEIVAAYNCGSHINITTKYVKYTSVSNKSYSGLNVRRPNFKNGTETKSPIKHSRLIR